MSESGPGEAVRPYSYPEVADSPLTPAGRELLALGELSLRLSAIAGSRPTSVQQVAAWTPGQVVELDRSPTDSIDIAINGRLVGTGHVIIDDGLVSVRIGEFIGQRSRRRRG